MIRRGFTERLLVGAGRRPGLVFASVAAVVLTGILLSLRLEFDPDVLHLLPTKNVAIRDYRQALEQFGTVDYFVAGIRVPENAPLDPFVAYGDRLAEEMTASGLFDSVESRLGEPEELLKEFLPRSVLFLDAAGRDRLAERLSDEAIRHRTQELRRQLETPQAVAMRDLLKLDPLGLSTLFLDRLGGKKGALAVDWTSGRYLSKDHRLLLVLGKPVDSPQNLQFNRHLVATMDDLAKKLAGEWPGLAEGVDLAAPETFWGGRYVITLHDTALIWRDVWVNAVTSIGGVLFLFWLAYRRASLLLLVFSPLVCGLAVTFGFASLAVGKLAATTAGVAALLVGLGDDFVIVLYGRYVAERARGASVEESLRAMGGATARGVILGAFTTAAVFYSFLITDFTGLYQMGLIVGTGILFCLLAVLLLVPAMIGWSEERHRRRESEPRLHIFAFGIERVTRWSIRYPRVTLVIAAVITVVFAFFVPGLGFDDSVEALRPSGNRGVLAQEEVNSHFGSGFDHMSLVVEAPTLEATLTLVDKAAAQARQLVEANQLGSYDAVTSVLPSPTIQAEALAWLERGRATGVTDPARVRATFERVCAEEGMRPEAFAPGLELLAQALTPAGPVTRESVLGTPQGATLLDRYLRQTPTGWASLLKIYNLPGHPKREVPQAALDLAAGLGPQARLSGMNVLSRSLRSEVRFDALLSCAIGLVVVVILLWIDFRSVRSAFLALWPLALGVVWMIGAMVALGLRFNFMNLFVLTMILGIGVDYGIHVIHRYLEVQEAGGDDVVEAVEETARGVLLAALTTMVGFGSLFTSHYPGLVSMGMVSTLGTFSTALISITVVPAWLFWRHGTPERAG